MRPLRTILGAALLSLLPSCSASPEEPPRAPVREPEPEPMTPASGTEVEEEPEPELPAPRVLLEVPTQCAEPGAEICTPRKEFTAKLCEKASPGFALAMFGKRTPFTRAYSRVDSEVWYADGTAENRQKLMVGEELLIVASRTGGTGGVQVIGMGSYDVFRWSGACVSVQSDEVTLKKVYAPKFAIDWRKLEDDVRAVLLADQAISYQNEMRQKFCKPGDMENKPCTQTLEMLNRLVADYVRKGKPLPVPEIEIEAE